jgi:hypothetical protein
VADEGMVAGKGVAARTVVGTGRRRAGGGGQRQEEMELKVCGGTEIFRWITLEVFLQNFHRTCYFGTKGVQACKVLILLSFRLHKNNKSGYTKITKVWI